MSERTEHAALAHLMNECTTLIIAHRLAAVHRVDRIAVSERDHVVAIGTHAQTLTENALYARLAALQLRSSTQTASSVHP